MDNQGIMDLNQFFPTEAQKASLDLADYRGASAHDRVQALLELSRLCSDLMSSSAIRSRQLELLDEEEMLEHQRWREVLKKHVPK